MENNDSHRDELIEDYLDGMLPEETVKDFEEEMKRDKSLAGEVRFRRKLRFVVKQKAAFQLNEKVKLAMSKHDIEPEYPNNNSSFFQIFKSNWIIFIAMIVIVGLSISSIPLLFKNNDHETILIEHIQYFDVYINYNPTNRHLLAQGLKVYEEKNYTEAIQYLKQYVEEKPSNAQPLLYLGLAYLFLDRPNEAIPYFQKLIEVKEMMFYEDSQWFLGLSYLKLNQVKEAKSTFELLKNSETYADKVSNVLEQL